MQRERIAELLCGRGGHGLELTAEVIDDGGGVIRSGILICQAEGLMVPIREYVPRFVAGGGYSESFGEQWNRFRRTQIDKFNGTRLSHDRFYAGTGWSPDELRGARVLEAGCGAGRFTQVMLDAGAQVFAVDLSSAVDACYKNNGPHERLCLVQADLNQIPLKPRSFDKVFCYGVLQHTPDPSASFRSLVPFLKPGGELAMDIYHKGWALEPYKTKYFYRPLTRCLSRDLLFRFITWYVPRWLPFDTAMKRIPLAGRLLGMLIPCWNYSYLPLPDQARIEWGILDTYDALAPVYDHPQTEQTVRDWFRAAGLTDIRVRLGGNGVLGNGRAPARME